MSTWRSFPIYNYTANCFYLLIAWSGISCGKEKINGKITAWWEEERLFKSLNCVLKKVFPEHILLSKYSPLAPYIFK